MLLPWPPFSTRIASAILGSSAGAYAMNSAWSRWRSWTRSSSYFWSFHADHLRRAGLAGEQVLRIQCPPRPRCRPVCVTSTIASRTRLTFSGLQRHVRRSAPARCWSARWSGCPGCGWTTCGRNTRAVVGQNRRGVRELQRRGQIVALADAHRDGVAGEPLLLEAALLPFLRGQQSADFAVDVDAGLLAEAELADELVDGVDAQILRQAVEIGVAGDARSALCRSTMPWPPAFQSR